MEWETEGVVLLNKKFIENKIITTVFTADFGLKKGVISARRKSYVIEPGNIVSCRWSARLEHHLGYLKIETLVPITSFCFTDSTKLVILNSILSLLIKILPENQEKLIIYQELVALLKNLKKSSENCYLQYVKFDLCVLKNLGFELELGKCTVTKSVENLAYISPKTGKVVSIDAGEKYKDRLLKLSNTLRDIYLNRCTECISSHEFVECIKITNYFLKKFIFDDYGFEFPYYRKILAEI